MSEAKLVEEYNYPPKVFGDIEFLIKLESRMKKIYEQSDDKGYLVYKMRRTGDAETAGAIDEERIVDALNRFDEYYSCEKRESQGFVSLTYFIPRMLLNLEDGDLNEDFYKGLTIQVARCWDSTLRYYYIEITSEEEKEKVEIDPFLNKEARLSLVVGYKT